MNPFKPTLYILYQFIQLRDGLKIVPVHYFRYALTIIPWLFAGGLIAFIISEIIGNNELGGYCFIPFALVFLYGLIRIHFDLKWTYGAQIVNSITITDGILTIEELAHTEGAMHFFRTYFDMPERNIVDTLHFPISSILEFDFAEEMVNDEKYFSLIASIAVKDENNELSRIDVPISPRLRKLRDIEDYAEIIAHYISIDDESE